MPPVARGSEARVEEDWWRANMNMARSVANPALLNLSVRPSVALFTKKLSDGGGRDQGRAGGHGIQMAL